MTLRSTLAPWLLAAALLLAGTDAGYALTCMSAGDLNTALSTLGAGNTLSISGTCTSNGSPFVVTSENVTLDGGGSAIIEDQIVVKAPGVTIQNAILNGSATASHANTGIVLLPNTTATIANMNINTWSGDGIAVDSGAGAAITGGTIDTGAMTGNAVNVFAGGRAAIGYNPVTGAQSSVTITASGNGVTAGAGSAVVINLPNITSNHLAGVVAEGNAAVEIVGGTIGSNGGDGIDISDGAAVVFNSTQFGGSSATQVTSNHGAGIVMFGGTLDIDTAAIGVLIGGSSAANDGDGIDASVGATVTIASGSVSDNFGGGINLTHAVAKLRNLAIGGNQGGPPISAILSTVDAEGVTINTPGSLGQPAILAFRSGVELDTDVVNGPTDANTLGAFGGTSVLLYKTTLAAADTTDPTLEVADGSSVVSAGGNTIDNSAASGPAIMVSNGSTFNEESSAVITKNFPTAADAITGASTVQMQSDMELGTGATTPSNWTGSIAVAQNSSFRMHGGMTISGGVTIAQGSNGFFNKTAGGTSTVNGTHVACLGTGTTHIVGGAVSVTPAVVMVTTGVGCYVF